MVGWSACLHVVAKMFHSHFINFCCLCSPILTILSPLESEMISAHMWNKIFHLALTLLLHLIKNCAVNIDNPSTFFYKNIEHFSKSVTQNKSKTVTLSEFVWCARNNRFSDEHFILVSFCTITQYYEIVGYSTWVR